MSDNTQNNQNNQNNQNIKSQNRCKQCNKKIKFTEILISTCRCGNLYCSLHRNSKEHNCSFNYLEHSQNIIQKNNPAVIPTKV